MSNFVENQVGENGYNETFSLTFSLDIEYKTYVLKLVFVRVLNISVNPFKGVCSKFLARSIVRVVFGGQGASAGAGAMFKFSLLSNCHQSNSLSA